MILWITLKLGVFQLVVFGKKDEVYGVRVYHKFPNFSPFGFNYVF
jgi:hypothetical protein